MKNVKHILVIDDDVDILDALQFTLELEGYTVTISDKAEYIEQIIHADGMHPDAIILDVMLSGRDGRVLCKKLKSNGLTRNIPVIMISAHPGAEPTVRAVGADAFLPKPFDIESLLQKLQISLK